METTDLEQPCIRLAKAAGYLHRKLDVGPGGKGWPDQAFWGPGGRHFIVEFKMPGKRPKGLQAERIQVLRSYGHKVHLIYDIEDFKMLIDPNHV